MELNAQGFYDPNAIAQLQADSMALQRRQALAQAMMGQGQQYIPQSGAAGIAAGIASLLRGRQMQGEVNDSVTDVLRRQFEMQNQAAAAQHAQEMADEERKAQREVEKLRLGEQFKRDYAPKQFTGGGVFDPSSGGFNASPEWMAQQLALEKSKAAISAANRAPAADPNAGLMAKLKLAQSMGATPDQLRAMVIGQQGAPDTQIVGTNIVDKATGRATPIMGPDGQPIQAQAAPLTAEARNKLALIDNALANATKFQQRTTAGQPAGGFNDVKSMLGDTPQLMKSAIQDMLYAKSGASAPVEEVRKAEAMYGPSRLHVPFVGETAIPTELDSTAAAKTQNFIDDLTRMRNEIAGSAPGGAAGGAQPTQMAVNPQTGQRIGLVNGQWVEI